MNVSVKFLIACLVVVFVVGPLSAVGIAKLTEVDPTQKTADLPTRTEKDFYPIIARASTNLHDSSGNPTFTITKIKKIAPNWHAVWIDDGMKTLINDSYPDAAMMQVLLGPASNFIESESSGKVPANIYKEFINEK